MAKTVWVVEDGDYSDYCVIGVYSEEASALQAASMFGGDVSEWPLDPGVDEINRGLKPYYVAMSRNGGNVSTFQENSLPGEKGYWIYESYGARKHILTTSVWATSKDHAIKIVNEKRIQILAADAWKPGQVTLV